mgnify:CR=1 FL=1
MSIWTATFWKATAERVIASSAGGALSAVGTDLFGILDVDGIGVLSLAGGAGLVSLLKALAAIKVTGTASIVGAETVSPKVGRHGRPA